MPAPSSLPPANSKFFLSSHRTWLRSLFCLIPLLAACLVPGLLRADETPTAKEDFFPLVKMAPFVVKGQSLEIAIYARTRSDRRYGEKFSEEVFNVVYEAVTESTGKGLVIIGAKGEPHPMLVFRKFKALAQEGKLDPAVAAREPELSAMMDRWQHTLESGQDKEPKKDADADVDVDFEKIITALPLPLEGIASKLYQLAWEENFDDARVEAKLRALRAGDLERRDLFKPYDWVFYLPPKGAFDKVLDEIISDALKKEDVNLLGRVAIKGILLAVKPKIRHAIESLRKGMLFMTVVQSRTHYSKDEVSALTNAYINGCLPKENPVGDNDHERAVNAVREQLKRIDAKAKKADVPTPQPASDEATKAKD